MFRPVKAWVVADAPPLTVSHAPHGPSVVRLRASQPVAGVFQAYALQSTVTDAAPEDVYGERLALGTTWMTGRTW